MSEQHPYRAPVPLVPEGTPRPLWSVMIPTYNSADYLRATLASVLAQDPGPDLMQIAVVDNCSTRDDPQAVIAELRRDRVEFYRQSENVGHVRNFNTCLQRSRGQLVHLLHSDDCVRKGFYRTMQHTFAEHPAIGAAFCRHIDIDERGRWRWIAHLEQPESGVLHNWLGRIATRQPLQPPAIVVRRAVYERLGSFDQRILTGGEDWEMYVRIAAHCPVWYETEPLALYRKHASSLTVHSARSGQNVRDLRVVMDIIRSYLPPAQADDLAKQARKNVAYGYVLYTAEQMLNQGDTDAAMVQIREALKTSRAPKVIKKAVSLVIRAKFASRQRAAQPTASVQPGNTAEVVGGERS